MRDAATRGTSKQNCRLSRGIACGMPAERSSDRPVVKRPFQFVRSDR